MKILIVDDSLPKATRLANILLECAPSADIVHASTAHDGFAKAVEGSFDLVLLDVVLPLSLGQPLSEEGSMWFVREAQKKIPDSAFPLIVGTTQYSDSRAKVVDAFGEYLWAVIYVSDSDDRWLRQVSYAVRYAGTKAERYSLSLDDAAVRVDVAIVTALRIPEFDQLVDCLNGGDPLLINETNESWLSCQVDLTGGRQANVVAACADEMGMSAMSALVTRLCIACRPRKLILAGIMGGNPARVGLADLVVVEETWNSMAGKITETGFEPDMKEQRCDYKLANSINPIITDELLLKLWQGWNGEKPRQIPQIHKGAVACSPAVIADGQTFAQLERQRRKVYGVEMEAFGCYDATHRLGDLAPKVICIKSVCDLGDKAKNDKYQRFCAFLSASVAVSLIKDTRFLDA